MSGEAFLRAIPDYVPSAPSDKTPLELVQERLDRIEHILGIDTPEGELAMDRSPAPRVRVIMRAVSWHMGVPESDIIGERRLQVYIRPRAAICWLAKLLTDYSLPQIGRVLGDRDHSTVVHLLAKAEKLRTTDPAFVRTTDKLARIFSEQNWEKEPWFIKGL